MKKAFNLIAIAAVCATAAGLACIPSPGGSGKLKVLITDKPFPFEFISKATVKITEVQVRTGTPVDQSSDGTEDATDTTSKLAFAAKPGNGQGDASEADEGAENAAFITIFEDAAGKEFNLLDLRNGKADLLADTEIPAGTYTQMRLIVTEGEVTLNDGRSFPVKVPSGGQSGIKLNLTFTVAADEETTLILDVDLSRAFSAIPSGHIDDVSTITGFHFHPSVAMRLINILEAGSISGTVTDGTNPLASVAVTAVKDGAAVSTAVTEADGTYKLGGLTTGTYTVQFSLTGYNDASAADVSVTAGQETKDVNAALTAVAPTP